MSDEMPELFARWKQYESACEDLAYIDTRLAQKKKLEAARYAEMRFVETLISLARCLDHDY